jgi:hypothetical protein
VGYFNARDLLFVLLERNNDFLIYTFIAVLLNAVVLSCCVRVLLWLDCPKCVQYLNRWAELQVTCTSISLNIRPIGIFVNIITLLISIKKLPVKNSIMQRICEVRELAAEFSA